MSSNFISLWLIASSRRSIITLFAILICSTSTLTAQEDVSQLNTVLEIDSLFKPLESKEVHGATAANLLQELQTKHYSGVEINDNSPLSSSIAILTS